MEKQELEELLNFNVNDIIDKDSVFLMIEKKIDCNLDYARVLLFLGKIFLIEKKPFIESKNITKLINKSYQSTNYLLKQLDSFNILNRIEPNKNFISVKYVLNDQEMLIDLLPKCKNHLGLDKKEGAK